MDQALNTGLELGVVRQVECRDNGGKMQGDPKVSLDGRKPGLARRQSSAFAAAAMNASSSPARGVFDFMVCFEAGFDLDLKRDVLSQQERRRGFARHHW